MITEVDFNGEECSVKLTGHLNQVAAQAYQIALLCYGTNCAFRWRLEHVGYTPPKPTQLADMGRFHIVYNKVV